jgi:Ni2+-binding GTPase involved in maturation of urease and hydrogenase
MSPPAKRARYVMIGGFLGAGKTTAMIRLGRHLMAKGLRVGLITNDQSVDLVDTNRVRAEGMPVAEVTGGCFCCKFDSLVEASKGLAKENAPDVLIAEPVGSCTDIKATVSYPLRQLYGDAYQVAPLSVVVDPVRCARVLGVVEGKSFSENVLYVYRKQLEEAEVLVVNKVDTVDPALRAKLVEALRTAYPQAEVHEVSCVTGEGLDGWFDRILSGDLGRERTMDVDYDVYADGEARLGWLNARGTVVGDAEFDGNALLIELTKTLRDGLAAEGVEVAHLKMTLQPDEGVDLGAISLTRTEADGVLTHTLKEPLRRGELVINLRAEAEPEVLRGMVESLNVTGVALNVEVLGAFRPGRPVPTHRVEA